MFWTTKSVLPTSVRGYQSTGKTPGKNLVAKLIGKANWRLERDVSDRTTPGLIIAAVNRRADLPLAPL
jgi:hypothetical protein